MRLPWLLAFSGGPDSTGLAARLRDRGIVLGYVDHGMRGARAGRAERAAAERIAGALGLPLRTARVEVEGRGEAEARVARYDALRGLACGCRGVLLAQTADDRAEGVLLALRRGTGLRGLASLRRRRRIHGLWRVRPALALRRAALRADAAPFDPVADRTNRATERGRARVRHLELAALAEALGEDPVPLLCALAERAQRLRHVLERRAEHLAAEPDRRILLAEPDPVFPYLVEAWRGEGPPLTRAAYASLRSYLAAGRGDRAHTTPAGDTWRNRPGGRFLVEGPGATCRPRTNPTTRRPSR
jgi:tRNA(Ile)-lysidine synthase